MAEHAIVEVVYALPDRQVIVAVSWREGLTATAAVEASGILNEFPEIPRKQLMLGIYGMKATGDQMLRPRDRVEICRPLQIDPRVARRASAAAFKRGQDEGVGSTSRSTRTTRSPSK